MFGKGFTDSRMNVTKNTEKDEGIFSLIPNVADKAVLLARESQYEELREFIPRMH